MNKNDELLRSFALAEREMALNGIYEEMVEVERDKNPFQTSETEIPYEYFCKKYVFVSDKATAEQEKMWDCLSDVQEATRKQAFKVGYDVAKNIFSSFVSEK